MKILFFGSFQHYSARILNAICKTSELEVVGVVTTPPMPVGRKQIITKTPVHEMAEAYQIPVITPDHLTSDVNIWLNQITTSEVVIDYFVTAGYGKILSKEWLEHPTFGSVNLHFSLLPKYRGANPAEWAIMLGERETGITLMQMDAGLDTGAIINQAILSIEENDTRETLYEKLYTLGAKQLPEWLIRYHEWQQRKQFPCQQSLAPKPQPEQSPTPYAALMKREDGFIPWETIQKSLQGLSLKAEDFPSKKLQKALSQTSDGSKFLSRLPRALAGYPSLWTIVQTTKGEKRMKIITVTTDSKNPSSRLQLALVQLEGQQPAHWNQIKNQLH